TDALSSIRRATIAGNGSPSAGVGGLFASGGKLSLLDSTVNGNTASPLAGGVHADNLELRVVNSTIVDNETMGTGGGMRLTGTTVARLNAVTIARNSAHLDAGGIAQMGTSLRADNVLL